MVGGWRYCWCFRNIVLPLSETSIFASENGHIPIKETCHRLPTIHPFSWGRVFISGRALDMVNTHPNGKFEKSSAAKDVHRPTLKGGVWGDSFPGFPKKKSWCFPINFGKSHFAVRTKLSFHQILDDDSLFFSKIDEKMSVPHLDASTISFHQQSSHGKTENRLIATLEESSGFWYWFP